MKINDDIIKELMLPFQEEGEKEAYYCYGVVTASVGKMMLLGTLASFANTYYILGFTDRKIIFIRLDMLGKIADKTVVTYDKIKNVKISGWFFGMGKKLNIRLVDNSKVNLKINKMTVGIHKQKENLIKICDMLKDKFNDK
ncbi:MAG: PH domain-containing protein [Bacillota bacterium]|nr:PH domain-containing protein [Bacillota bacterium]